MEKKCWIYIKKKKKYSLDPQKKRLGNTGLKAEPLL